MLLAHAPRAATIDSSITAHVTLELVRLVVAIYVSVATPVAGNASPLVAQESGTRWMFLTLLRLDYLEMADALVRVAGLAK